MADIYDIYGDGGSRGNPGPAACAFTICKNSRLLFETGVYLGTTTNNQAEYSAVINALQWLVSHLSSLLPGSQINFYLDSLLIVNQINGLYKIKDEKLYHLHQQVTHLLLPLTNFKIKFSHVSRNNNTRADALVNQTLDNLLA